MEAVAWSRRKTKSRPTESFQSTGSANGLRLVEVAGIEPRKVPTDSAPIRTGQSFGVPPTQLLRHVHPQLWNDLLVHALSAGW